MIDQVQNSSPREADELRRRVAELEEQCQQMAKALKEAQARQDLERQRFHEEMQQFIYAASHDLQEPLRKVQTFGNLLSRSANGLSDQGRDYIKRMQEAAGRMHDMIEGLLKLSRVTTRAQPPEPVDLNEVAQAVADSLRRQVERTKGRLEVGRLRTIEAEPEQMQQLLWHLIHNGLKFRRPETPPVVRVHGKLLKGRAEGVPPWRDRYQVFVEDNGIGFEGAFADRIFRVFQRLHGQSEYGGTGIGLALCRKIAERHGGDIAVRSAPGKGTTFIVTLPVRQVKEEGAL
jgi:light-regulated signal transduction histidine kinase (bacteriophytochrome)